MPLLFLGLKNLEHYTKKKKKKKNIYIYIYKCLKHDDTFRMGRVSEDCLKTCPCCGEGNQSFEH